MKDPLRIFTKEQLKTLNPFHLRQLKKEFFIPFNFGDSSTVVLNNHEVDKATLEDIFQELESNLDDYIFDTKSELLNDFLYGGNIDFLFNEVKCNEVKNLIKNQPNLESKIAQKLSFIITDICQKVNDNAFNTLHKILDFTADFNPEHRKLAYQKSYEVLKEKIDNLGNANFNPFIHDKKVIYKDEVAFYVNPSLAKMFDYLPERFSDLDGQYCAWCLMVIVKKTTSRGTTFNQLSKRDLQIFHEAYIVASRYYDSPTLKENMQAITEHARDRNFTFKGFSGAGGMIMMIIAIVMFMVQFSRWKSSSSSHSPYSERLIQDEEMVKINEILHKKFEEREAHRNNGSYDESIKFDSSELKLLKEFVGKKKGGDSDRNTEDFDFKSNYSKSEICKYYSGGNSQLILANESDHFRMNDTLIVFYQSDIFPNERDIIKNFLPTLTKKDTKPEYKIANITFMNNDLNFNISHYLNLNYDEKGALLPALYKDKQSDNNVKLVLKAKRIPYANFHIKGYISRKETKSGSIKGKVRFNIIYDQQFDLFVVEYGRNQLLNLSKSEIEQPAEMNDKEAYSKKFASILKNLNLLHSKNLILGSWYTLDSVTDYTILPNTKLNENSFEFQNENGNLRYNFTSFADNISYCELNTNRTSIKYIVDHKSGITKGMIRATVSEDKNEIEQIVAIRQD